MFDFKQTRLNRYNPSNTHLLALSTQRASMIPARIHQLSAPSSRARSRTHEPRRRRPATDCAAQNRSARSVFKAAISASTNKSSIRQNTSQELDKMQLQVDQEDRKAAHDLTSTILLDTRKERTGSVRSVWRCASPVAASIAQVSTTSNGFWKLLSFTHFDSSDPPRNAATRKQSTVISHAKVRNCKTKASSSLVKGRN